MAWNRLLAFPLVAIVLTLGTATRLAAQQSPHLRQRQPRHGGRSRGRRADAPARAAQGHLASGERRRRSDPGLRVRRGGEAAADPGSDDPRAAGDDDRPHGAQRPDGAGDALRAAPASGERRRRGDAGAGRDPAGPLRGRRARHVPLLRPHAGRRAATTASSTRCWAARWWWTRRARAPTTASSCSSAGAARRARP